MRECFVVESAVAGRRLKRELKMNVEPSTDSSICTGTRKDTNGIDNFVTIVIVGGSITNMLPPRYSDRGERTREQYMLAPTEFLLEAPRTTPHALPLLLNRILSDVDILYLGLDTDCIGSFDAYALGSTAQKMYPNVVVRRVRPPRIPKGWLDAIRDAGPLLMDKEAWHGR